MRRRQAIKDPPAELRLFRRRVGVLLIVMALAGAGLLARLAVLQVAQHKRYATASRDNSIRAEVIAPARGVITDRSGVLLAENVSSYSLYLTPENVPGIDATLAALGQVIALRPADLERFASLRRSRPRFEALLLRRHLDDTEAARFAAQRHRFPGVELRGDLSRHYPQGTLTAHVVGYVGRVSEAELATASAEQRATDAVGKSGVEKSYDTALQGRVGYQQVEVDAHGRRLRVLDRTRARPGFGVVEREETLAWRAGVVAGPVVALAIVAVSLGAGFQAGEHFIHRRAQALGYRIELDLVLALPSTFDDCLQLPHGWLRPRPHCTGSAGMRLRLVLGSSESIHPGLLKRSPLPCVAGTSD